MSLIGNLTKKESTSNENIFSTENLGSLGSDTGEIDGWPMYGYNPKHTRFPDSEGPTTPIIKWNFATGDKISSSPAIDDNKLFIGSYDHNLYCINIETGTKLWSYETNDNISSSPAVMDGKVYVGSHDFKVYCLNTETGQPDWIFETGDIITSSPTISGSKVYIGSFDDKLYCLDINTGTESWNYTATESIAASPVIANGHVYFCSIDGRVYCLDANDKEEKWTYQTHYLITTSPSFFDNKLYLGLTGAGGGFICLGAETESTGSRLKWHFSVDSIIQSSPAIANGKIYFNSKYNMYCLDASTGTEVWDYPTGSLPMYQSSPVVTPSNVYFADGSYYGTIYCLDHNKNEIWTYELGNAIRSSPSIVDGYLYVGCYDHNVYCLGNQPPETPTTPQGPSEGIVGEEYEFSTNTIIDSDGDQVFYFFDWGNGETSGWIQTPSATNIWGESGTYQIKVKAKDIHNEESSWSDSHTISIAGSTVELLEIDVFTSSSVAEGGEFEVLVLADNTPLADCQVEIDGQLQVTDNNGKVTFTGPSVDEDTQYIITARKTGYQTGTTTILVVAHEEVAQGILFGIASADTLLLENVKVEIRGEKKSWVAYSDSQGNYYKAIPTGSYTVHATKQGYSTFSKQVDILEKTALECDISLQLTGTKGETTVLDYLLQNQIDQDSLGAEIEATSTDPHITFYSTIDVDVVTAGFPNNNIEIQVEGEEDTGKYLVIYIAGVPNPEDITIDYDGEQVERTRDILSFFTTIDYESWILIPTENSGEYVILFYIPHFSEHTITIHSIVEAVGGITAFMFYIVICIVAGVLFLSRFYMRPLFLTYFRKKRG